MGIGYYVGLTIGTVLVMAGVMICFEIARRATYFRVVFGIKGGHEEVAKIYPYNQMQNRNYRMAFAVFSHALAVVMIITLLTLVIGVGFIG
jgi:hypothetical protein